jgi:hypothetical protein
LLKAWMKLAPGAAMAMSQVMASEAPAPAATPLTAAMWACAALQAAHRGVEGLLDDRARGRRVAPGPDRGVKSNSDRSAPAQNARARHR